MTKLNQGIYKEKDPKGNYYAGVLIPQGLRSQFPNGKGGFKTWFQKSTGTNKIEEANRVGAPLVEQFKRQIEEARRRVKPLNAEQTGDIVKKFVETETARFKRRLAEWTTPEFALAFERRRMKYLAQPNQSVKHPVDLENSFLAEDGGKYHEFLVANGLRYGMEQAPLHRDTDQAAEFLTAAMEEIGIAPDHPSYAELREAIRQARQSLAADNIGGNSNVGSMVLARHQVRDRVLTFDGIMAKWAKERGHEGSKEEVKYKSVVNRFVKHLSHGNAAIVTGEDVRAWKDAMVEEGWKHVKIKGHLNKLRTIYRFARSNFSLKDNPTDYVDFRAKPDLSAQRRGFTEDEARKALLASRAHQDKAIRWATWLCCFLGARIGEVCGASVSDVKQIDGYWTFRIDPNNREEGETVKNPESIRTVPLHPAVIEEGFIGYVKSIAEKHGSRGPLFPTLTPNKYGQRGERGSRIICGWIRGELGLTDPRLPPAHGWRHRHEDVLRDAGVAEEHRFALQGHKSQAVGARYGRGRGKFSMKILYEAACKMPNPAA
jgi:integrase